MSKDFVKSDSKKFSVEECLAIRGRIVLVKTLLASLPPDLVLQVSLTDRNGSGYLAAKQVSLADVSQSSFEFGQVPPGIYVLKIQGAGLTSLARLVRVQPPGTSEHDCTSGVSDALTTIILSKNKNPEIELPMQKLKRGAGVLCSLDEKSDGIDTTDDEDAGSVHDPNHFYYQWSADATVSGVEEVQHVCQPVKVQYLDEPTPIQNPSFAASDALSAEFGVLLCNEGGDQIWNQETAQRLLDVLRMIPRSRALETDLYRGRQALIGKQSKWMLTNKNLDDDITIVKQDSAAATHLCASVTISAATFVHAAPRLVLLDGQRGRYFSRRLHHALVRFVTDHGRNDEAVDAILDKRYGCSVRVPDYPALTSGTTDEDEKCFQAFHPEELLQIINMFEEMPEGFHKIPALKYLIRRQDGHPHPTSYPAPAVAWIENNYIEFMTSAFDVDPDHMHRLLLHEKAHFIYATVMSKQMKEDWIEIGEWYEDKNSASGWATKQQVEFVSAYAHQKNPNEDMAESISYYVKNPDKLLSRAPRKFAFIRDRLMHGTRYVSSIREDLTFEVLNLFPDYHYPGRINRVRVQADGAPDEDKVVKVELELNTVGNAFIGGTSAYLRVFSEIGTFIDFYCYPKTRGEPSSVLSGEFTISKYAKSGSWRPGQIIITDATEAQRMTGHNDYGWQLHVLNPLEVITLPKYVPHSLKLSVKPHTDADEAEQSMQIITADWLFTAGTNLRRSYASLALTGDDKRYPIQRYGTYVEDSQSVTEAKDNRDKTAVTSGSCSVQFEMSRFQPSGRWAVPLVTMQDVAGNEIRVEFSESELHQPRVSIQLDTTDVDSKAPEVSLNDDSAQGLQKIRVKAAPTDPKAPNGETNVSIRFQARDDKSGVGTIEYRLLDPQGVSHHDYHYHANFHSLTFKGDPTAWQEYEIKTVLPVGSAPGIWGLQELVVEDKAGNKRVYDFVETVQFDVAAE